MADKIPTPLNGGAIDAGTLASMRHQSPASSGLVNESPRSVMSQEAKAVVDTVAGNAALLSYDAFIRKYVYEPACQAISRQGEEFVRQNIMTRADAANWVNAQRNSLLLSLRDERNSPLGRAYAEYLKPRGQLPSVADLAKKYPGATQDEIFNAIIQSGSRTRGSVNKLAVVFRWAGPVLMVASVAVSAHLVAEAPPNQRWRVASREAGGIVGGVGGGWAGAKAGCATGALVGVWFEGVGAIPGCAIGAIAGGLGGGWAGSSAGSWIGERAFDWTNSVVVWTTK